MLLEISEVEENRIKTTFLEGTSYIASSVRLKRIEIRLENLDDKNTQVTLTINFDRKLDPYWYFAPVERYGIRKTAELLRSEIIARETS